MADGLLQADAMGHERLRKSIRRSGGLNVELEGVPHHSPYNPRRKAAKFYGAYSIGKADVILQFGWDLEYRGEIIASRLKRSARVIVLEPDEDLFKFFLSHIDNRAINDDRQLRYAVGNRVCHFFDKKSLEECRETDERIAYRDFFVRKMRQTFGLLEWERRRSQQEYPFGMEGL
jgi:hypothetical protein